MDRLKEVEAHECTDRELLIRIDERVNRLNRIIPPLARKVNRHEKIFLVMAALFIGVATKAQGGWETIRETVKGFFLE